MWAPECPFMLICLALRVTGGRYHDYEAIFALVALLSLKEVGATGDCIWGLWLWASWVLACSMLGMEICLHSHPSWSGLPS